MMKTSDLCNKWNEFKGQNGFLQRLDPSHPMDFFIGISDKGYDELALMTDAEPAKLISSKAIEVDKNIRKDGRWATQIALVETQSQSLFARFCLDLVECSQFCKSEAEGLSSVTRRYLAWQQLFTKLKETLPNQVLKGLIGELELVKIMVSKGISKDDAISSWQGPDGADRDFILDNKWYENKAISTGKDRISISSLNQLEIDKEGVLSVIYIDESSCTDGDAICVRDYIDSFRTFLSDAPVASVLFEQKLLSLGYIDKEAYSNIYFKVGNHVYYKVDKTFPKITTSDVANEIIEVKYSLSIAGIQPWKIGENEAWN